ncbi:2-oxoglutarate dehydrogenase complex dihydrolipoyllysine-residue succinyltransferase [Corallococcus exiguus]|uniref:2-oxoglutarate dehydrogenase complex dihydrolipoyllysine-residue succinyltransferase n=1 Tax=Corallococcus TaxID=83461 RepID=UPI000EEF11B6|nr:MULTISPECIES: 2-oxoglutarate dehydrogenase complex dihydrolipoyllysine-residue succinyltransferase [Corallococcus]MBN8465583.1 2-oxoglutarate dehydrogenase complex dihydrolipoyllysine-residue succinyltransferase [Corallococcus exiguus]NNC16576.1 2-oxoglutarate dehydrogenase complex dihydrolipoyllysine-residue succinyltransferase [Corallococcus exiguus]NRD54228.1 2-oxoglutarate dehydrogenase complex dihydrolipoyllysine-residue succinyltransferase [Corallococcus exiguus]NRD61574.1 2-oxoglutara
MAVELKVPPLGESITEAVVGKWNKKQGESVTADEPLVVLETDKVTIDVPAPAAGSVASIAFKEGDKVRVGDVLGTIEAGAGAAASPAVAAATPAPAQAAAPVSTPAAPAGSDTRITPTARKMAEENRVDVGQLKGSGTGGRIMKEDVQGQLNRPSAPPAPAAPSGPRPNAAREERVRMTPLRKRVAERLLQAQSNAALLTTFNEVDMGEVMALRKKYNDKFQAKHGVKLGFMSFFIRASVEALKAFPQINAEIDGEDVIFKHYYDIGVAVSGSRGLVVPVVRDADKLSLADLEKTVGDYGGRARNDKLTMADLTGGTFTITNGGIFGSMLSTPILNPPQTGILGMHNIVERPVARDGQVVIRPIMYIALTYDHRLVDGREAVQFLVRVKECIEDPERLLLDI